MLKLSTGLLAIFLAIISLENAALGASARKAIIIVEAPYKVPEAVPSGELLQRAMAFRRELSERFLGLHFQGFTLVDGRNAISPPSVSVFENADLVIQVELRVSSLGFYADARIYDKGKNQWFEVSSTVSDSEDRIESELIPQVFVRAIELAQPSDRAILLADCFAPASDSDATPAPDGDPVEKHARRFSVRYAQTLQQSGLEKRFSIVPLVTDIMPKFFKWWCVDLAVPRVGGLRDDTITIYGLMEVIGKSDNRRLSLLLGSDNATHQGHPARDSIIIDLDHIDATLQQIEQIAGSLANEQ